MESQVGVWGVPTGEKVESGLGQEGECGLEKGNEGDNWAAAMTCCPPQGRHGLASFPPHHTPLIKRQLQDSSSHPEMLTMDLEEKDGQGTWAWILRLRGAVQRETALHCARVSGSEHCVEPKRKEPCSERGQSSTCVTP